MLLIQNTSGSTIIYAKKIMPYRHNNTGFMHNLFDQDKNIVHVNK